MFSTRGGVIISSVGAYQPTEHRILTQMPVLSLLLAGVIAVPGQWCSQNTAAGQNFSFICFISIFDPRRTPQIPPKWTRALEREQMTLKSWVAPPVTVLKGILKELVKIREMDCCHFARSDVPKNGCKYITGRSNCPETQIESKKSHEQG